jgi:hypothetical protein
VCVCGCARGGSGGSSGGNGDDDDRSEMLATTRGDRRAMPIPSHLEASDLPVNVEQTLICRELQRHSLPLMRNTDKPNVTSTAFDSPKNSHLQDIAIIDAKQDDGWMHMEEEEGGGSVACAWTTWM